MRITFLFTDNFPGNSAYFNRIHSLAKGLIRINDEVDVAIVYPGQRLKSPKTDLKRGKYDEVKFQYFCVSKFKHRYRILQILDGIWGAVHYFFHVLVKRKKNRPDFIISCSSSLLHLIVLWLLSKLKKIKILREYNEYPLFIQNNKRTPFKISRYKLFDGFIFMTERLENFFKHNLKINRKSTIVNMTVDTDRFENVKPVYNSSKITIVGDILGEKDGVGILIDSFKIIHERYPDITLRLVGNISNKQSLNDRLEKLKKLGLTSFVEFTGLIDRECIPDILANSKLLLLSRPTSLQAESGFPTKLGEYLLSGVPTVITRTGELEKFLTDNKTTFFAEPDNAVSFAERVIFALDNYNFAINVGYEGKKVAYNHFSNIKQAKVLHDFLLNF